MAEKYLVQEESLISIADAIRAKAGTSDKLAFPAGFADAIAAIQAGGGGDIKMTHGDFTLSEEVSFSESFSKYEIEHGLGCVPRAFMLLSTVTSPATNDLLNVSFAEHGTNRGWFYFARYGGSVTGSGDRNYVLRMDATLSDGKWLIYDQSKNIFADDTMVNISRFAYSEHKNAKLNTRKYVWFALSYD